MVCLADSSRVGHPMPPQTPSKIRVGTWEATFPVRQETPEESTLFMKRMLYIAFSQIIRYRHLLPDECFKKRKFEGVRLAVFNMQNAMAVRAAEKLRGACTALDEKYLKKLILVVSEDENDDNNACEVYSMQVSYACDQTTLLLDGPGKSFTEIKYRGPESVRTQTKQLLTRLLQITGHLDALPPHAFATFRITYYDERTPSGYQPTGFYPTPILYTLDRHAESVNIGSIHTKEHACFVSVQSVYIDDHMELEERLSSIGTADGVLGNNSSLDSSIDMDTSYNNLPTREEALSSANVRGATTNSPAQTNEEPAAEVVLSVGDTHETEEHEATSRPKRGAKKQDVTPDNDKRRGRPPRATQGSSNDASELVTATKALKINAGAPPRSSPEDAPAPSNGRGGSRKGSQEKLLKTPPKQSNSRVNKNKTPGRSNNVGKVTPQTSPSPRRK